MLCVPVDHCFTLSCSHISGQRLIEFTFFPLQSERFSETVWYREIKSCPVLVIWLCESVFQLLPLYACRVFLFLFSVVQNLIWRKSWQARTTQELSVQSKLSELDSACDMWEESWHLCQRWLSLHQLTCALISSLSESVFISSVIVSVLTFRWSKNNHFCSCWFLFHQAKLINRTRLNFHC